MEQKKRKPGSSLLVFLAGAVLLVGGTQFVAYTFPEAVIESMYGYYAFRAGVEEQSVEVDGYEIPYYRGGTGPTLVLVHGFGDSKISFLQTAQYLTDDYDVIMLDVPGFGRTELDPSRSYSIEAQAEMLHRFLQKLGVQTFFLGGNSMGGHISAAYTLKHPERVRKLLLLNAAGLRVDDPVPYKPNEKPLESVAEFDLYIEETFVNKPFIPQAFKLHFVSNSMERFDWLNHIRREIRQGGDYVLNQRADQIRTETLILWGDSDTVVSPAHA